MTDVIDRGGWVEVVYSDSDGDTRSIAVVGDGIDSVRSRKDEIVSAHR